MEEGSGLTEISGYGVSLGVYSVWKGASRSRQGFMSQCHRQQLDRYVAVGTKQT